MQKDENSQSVNPHASDAGMAAPCGLQESALASRIDELEERNQLLEQKMTDLEQAAHAMQESRNWMHALLEASGESALLLDPDGVILASNSFAAARYGQTPDSISGKNFFTLMTPELAASRRAAITEPFVIDGTALTIGVSIGIALFPQHGDTVEDILNAADHAMYQA